jgi:hypothetical protein
MYPPADFESPAKLLEMAALFTPVSFEAMISQVSKCNMNN